MELPRLETGILQLELEFDGPLRVTLVVPDSIEPSRPIPLIVSLHYAGEVTPFYGRGPLDKLFLPALGELGAVMIAPDARGGDWTTPLNESTVVELTRQAMSAYPIDPRRVLLTGFSMGARGAWHLGPRHADLFTAALAVAGRPSPGPDWPFPACIIHSRDDELIPIALPRQAAEEQIARGAPVEFRELTGYTHANTASYVEPVRAALPWLRTAWGER